MRTDIRRYGALAFALLTVQSPAFSSGMDYIHEQVNYLFPEPAVARWFAGLSAGPVWVNAGDHHQTVSLNPGQQNTYNSNSSNQTVGDIELFLGIQSYLADGFPIQTGLALAATGSTDISGNVWVNGNPATTNYTYSYQIRHFLAAFKGKLLFDMGYYVTPWISATIGVGFNRSSGFSSTPTAPSIPAMPKFANNNTTAFSYALGLGVQRTFNPHWQMGVGYEFADWGKSQLGTASGQTLGFGLSIADIYTNSLVFNVTYLG